MANLNQVIALVAECLAGHIKAYNLVKICENYGLDTGDDSEAFMSKRSYVLNRLKSKPDDFIFSLTKKIIEDYPCTELSKVAYQYFDQSIFSISPSSRRTFIDDFLVKINFVDLEKLPDLLVKVWDLESWPSTDSRLKNALQDIFQHIVNNDDWSWSYLFEEYLEVFYLSDKSLIKLFEAIVHPIFNKNENQARNLNLLNEIIIKDGFRLEQSSDREGHPVYKCLPVSQGVTTHVKNLIFASNGFKPEIVIADALSNDIKIIKNQEHCLVYDRTIKPNGLLWYDLVSWWCQSNQISDFMSGSRSLYSRLFESLDSPPEKIFFKTYFEKYHDKLEGKLPALIPQVYLHYDPYTLRNNQGVKRLVRQRMDFLFLLPNKNRVVIEIDGKHHYSEGDKSNPRLYSEMVSEDRSLKLRGYEVYRFGGYELDSKLGNPKKILDDFFESFFHKYNLI